MNKDMSLSLKRHVTIIYIILLTLSLYCPFNGQGGYFSNKTDLSNAQASFLQENSDDLAGSSVCIVGDINKDGFDDIMIGAREYDNSKGKAYLFFGKSDGWIKNVRLSSSDASFIKGTGFTGCSISGLGDVNGDTYDDFIIGSFYGHAYLFFGKKAGWVNNCSVSNADSIFLAETDGDWAGYSVAGAGDVNGDGYNDILIGAIHNASKGINTGKVYLILGKNTGWLKNYSLSNADASFIGERADSLVGSDVDGIGDINKDTYDDFMIAASWDDEGGTNAGQVYLIYGKPSGWKINMDLNNSDASFIGERMGSELGHSIAGLGDVNGDGMDDFLLGALKDSDNGYTASGQIYLYFSTQKGWKMNTIVTTANASFIGEGTYARVGYDISSAGDVNNDGYNDFIMSSVNTIRGITYLIYGKQFGWKMDQPLSISDTSFYGENGNDWAGNSIHGGGDVNGDGYDDIIIGAFMKGKIYLIFQNFKPTPPKDLQIILSKNGSYLELSWGKSFYFKQIIGYNVYRSIDGSNYKINSFLKDTITTYKDYDVKIGETYFYKVTAIGIPGEESYFSEIMVIINDYDIDIDGIGNDYDIDDDNDGTLDQSDVFPMNSTEWLDTDWDGIGNTKDLDDDNDGIVDSLDAEPMNSLNGLRIDISYINDSVALSHEELSDMMNEIKAGIGEINDSIINRIDELDQMITSQMYQLNQLIKSVNASISSQISSLDQDLSTFKSDMDSLFLQLTVSMNDSNTEIENRLIEMQMMIQAISPEIHKMNVSIMNSIENSLGIIKDDLGMISDEVQDGDEEQAILIDGIIIRIEGYQNETKERFHNITSLMATKKTLDDLYQKASSLEKDLETLNELQDKVGEIKKEQEGTSSRLSMTTVLLAVAIILQITLLLLLFIVLMKKNKTQDEQRVESTENAQNPIETRNDQSSETRNI